MNIGRLDVNSEGLLLLSTDGPLAQAMMSPDNGLARVYRVRVRGALDAGADRQTGRRRDASTASIIAAPNSSRNMARAGVPTAGTAVC